MPENNQEYPNSDYKPARLDKTWLITEYLISFFFGFVGIVIGVITISAYKTLANGKRVRMYDEYTIKHAKIMIVIGIVRTLAPIISNLVQS